MCIVAKSGNWLKVKSLLQYATSVTDGGKQWIYEHKDIPEECLRNCGWVGGGTVAFASEIHATV